MPALRRRIVVGPRLGIVLSVRHWILRCCGVSAILHFVPCRDIRLLNRFDRMFAVSCWHFIERSWCIKRVELYRMFVGRHVLSGRIGAAATVPSRDLLNLLRRHVCRCVHVVPGRHVLERCGRYLKLDLRCLFCWPLRLLPSWLACAVSLPAALYCVRRQDVMRCGHGRANLFAF